MGNWKSEIVSARGQMLAELLIAITIGVLIAAIGAELTTVSFQATRSSKQQNEGMGLAQEGMEAMRAIVRSNSTSSQGWNKIYLPPEGTGVSSTKGVANPFHPVIISNEWRLAAGSENITISGSTYTRSIVIENTSRASSTSAIQSTYSATYDDPSTQKIRVIVSRTGFADIELVSYFTRFLNESLAQTNWNGSLSDAPVDASSTTANVGTATEENNINRTGTPGSVKLKTN